MVTIALADDHAIVRQGLRLLLESDPEFVVVGEAADGLEALKLVKRRKPQVLIVDLMMPGMDGLETTRRVSYLKSDTRVILLTMYGDQAYLFEALGNGAAGYVVKDSCGSELFEAIRGVVADRRYLSPLLSEALVQRSIQKFRTILLKRSHAWTTRERKVLQQVLEGANSSEIAARLKLALRTVNSHLAKFAEILGVSRYNFNTVPVKAPRKRRKKNNNLRISR